MSIDNRVPQIPPEYVDLSCDWYSGQDDLLYAVASTGNLTLGSVRPTNEDAGELMTDAQWLQYLYSCLAADIRACLRTMGHNEDRVAMEAFLQWVERTEGELE